MKESDEGVYSKNGATGKSVAESGGHMSARHLIMSQVYGGLIMCLISLSGCSWQPVNQCPAAGPLVVRVTADRPEARYLNCEKTTFMIEVTFEGRPATRGEVEVWLSKDGGPVGTEKKRFDLALQNPIHVVGAVDEPAFFLCQAWATVDPLRAYGEKMVWYRAPVDPALVTINLVPDRAEALYHCGEPATFTARVLQNGEPVTDGQLELCLSLDGDDLTLTKEIFDLAGSKPLKISGTLHEAAFLYCKARLTRNSDKNHPVSEWISVGYDVEKIVPETVLPKDFEAFWKDTLAKARQLPENVELQKIEELSNSKATYYRFGINTLNQERVYGFLGVPCGPGPFPALVLFPGAGQGAGMPWDIGLTAPGAITLTMNVHKYPVTELPAEAKKQMETYNAQHHVSNYVQAGISSRETYHFYAVLAGFCRALDYVCARGDWDRKHLVLMGGSQGGFLSLAIGSLYADKVSSAVAEVPYLCDYRRSHRTSDSASLETMAYYDPVNFVRFLRCPFQLSVSFVDGSCPPVTVFGAYNAIPRKDKNIMMEPRAGHGVTPDRQAMGRDYVLRGLGFQ